LKCTDELGRPYYFNKATKTSTWVHPLGAQFQAMQNGGVDDDVDDEQPQDQEQEQYHQHHQQQQQQQLHDAAEMASSSRRTQTRLPAMNEMPASYYRPTTPLDAAAGMHGHALEGSLSSSISRAVSAKHRMKSREQKVNEALRTKCGTRVKEMEMIERKISQIDMGRNHVTNCRARLQKFLDAVLRELQMCERRTQLHAFGDPDAQNDPYRNSDEPRPHNGLKEDVDIALEGEYKELLHTRQKLSNYVAFSHKVLSYLGEMETRLHRALANQAEFLDLDRQCLGLSTRTKHMPRGVAKEGVGSLSVLTDADDLTTAQLLDHVRALEHSVRTFARQTTECIETDKEILRQFHRKTNLSVRNNLLECTQLMMQIKEALTANNQEVQIVLKSEKKIKAALAAQFKPLELCQRRYELRMQKPQRDSIRLELEQELRDLGQTVRTLEAELVQTQRELQTFLDIQGELEDQLAVQQALVGLATHSLALDRRAAPRDPAAAGGGGKKTVRSSKAAPPSSRRANATTGRRRK
jgi:hypothetical protein